MSISNEQKAYLKKYKREKAFVLFSQFIIVIILLFSWEYASNNGLLNKFIFSCPSEIVKTIVQMIKKHYKSFLTINKK